MQVMPSTAARLGVATERLLDPEENIRAGVLLLASLLDTYQGDVISTVVAYDAGPQPALAPLPRNAETPPYVWRVLGFYEAYSGLTAANGPGESAPGREWPFPAVSLRERAGASVAGLVSSVLGLRGYSAGTRRATV